MGNTKQSKIIFRNGFQTDLPVALEPAEVAMVTDTNTLLVGCDPRYGQPQYNRSQFPYQNIEILTEKSEAAFTKLHGECMREGGRNDYYEARLAGDRLVWTNIQIEDNDELFDYMLPVDTTVNAFIDYSVTIDANGETIRHGKMVMQYNDGWGDPSISDYASHSRDPSLLNSSNYDARDVFGRVKFRFARINSLLYFQYKNWSFDPLTLCFRMSRPTA